MSELNTKHWNFWKKELVVATVWVFVLTVALIIVFVLLGGFHGSGGDLFSIATTPIGFLHLIGVGNGALGAVSAVVAEFGSMLAFVLLVRAIGRKF